MTFNEGKRGSKLSTREQREATEDRRARLHVEYLVVRAHFVAGEQLILECGRKAIEEQVSAHQEDAVH